MRIIQVLSFHRKRARKPRLFRAGRNGAFLILGRGGEAPACLSSKSILIPICSLDHLTVRRSNPINGADAKRSAFAYAKTSQVGSCCLEGLGHDRPHPVSCLKATDAFLTHQVAHREAALVPVRAAVLSSSGGGDAERFQPARRNGRHLTYAQGVEGMRLLDAEPGTIPARPPARPGADGKPEDPQDLDQLEARRIDRRCILERVFRLDLDLRVAPFGSRLVPFGLITCMAGQTEIADPARPAPAPGPNVVQFERTVRFAAVGAPIRILAEQISARLPSRQGALLVVRALNFWMLEQVRVEADALHFDALHRCEASTPLRPGEDIADAGKQRWRQPALWDAAVGETGSAISEMGASAAATGVPLGLFGHLNLVPAVSDLREEDGMMDFPFFRFLHPSHGDAGRFRARINLERERLERRVFHAPVAQPDNEGFDTMDHRPATPKQEACPFGSAGHQRLFVAVKDEHHGLFLSENPRKGLFDGPETAFPERSSRQCWIGLFGSEHTSYPERAFNPERESYALRRRA